MEWILTTAGVAFVLAVLVAPFAIKKLRELKFGQKILEDGPTWHMSKQGTPTMGGVIFIVGMLAAVLDSSGLKQTRSAIAQDRTTLMIE